MKSSFKMGWKFHWILPESDTKWRFYNYVCINYPEGKMWMLFFKLWKVWGHVGVY